MFSIDQILTVTFTLFAVIDMPGSIPILVSLKDKQGEIEPVKATLASAVLMLLFLFVGESFLGLLGLDLKSFAIAGSIVIFLIGLEMVLGLELFKPDPDSKSGSIIPIAFPLIAGSGTLTTLISLKDTFHTVNIVAAILINLIIIFIVLNTLHYWERLLGKSGLMVVRKFFGVILLAISIKIFKSSFGLL